MIPVSHSPLSSTLALHDDSSVVSPCPFLPSPALAPPSALPQLIKDGKLAVEKGLTPAVRTLPSGGQHGYVKGLVDYMVPHLVNVLPSVAPVLHLTPHPALLPL